MVAGLLAVLLDQLETGRALLSSALLLPLLKGIVYMGQRTFVIYVVGLFASDTESLHTVWTCYNADGGVQRKVDIMVAEDTPHALTVHCAILKIQKALILSLLEHPFGDVCIEKTLAAVEVHGAADRKHADVVEGGLKVAVHAFEAEGVLAAQFKRLLFRRANAADTYWKKLVLNVVHSWSVPRVCDNLLELRHLDVSKSEL